ncbi:MAG: HD domain-containing protein [Anaerolineaceae bacterium]|nr:HD domain-containing protein [Anaerolineaceae bacterium]
MSYDQESEFALNTVLKATGYLATDKVNQLVHLSQTLVSASTLEGLLENITRYVVDIIEVSFSRFLLDMGSEGFICKAACYRGGGERINVRPDPVYAQRIYSRVMKRGTALVISHQEPSLSLDESRVLHLYSADTVCLVPVRQDEQHSGLLVLGYDQGGAQKLFHEGQLRLARLIAEQAAFALRPSNGRFANKPSHMETILALANVIQSWDPMMGGHSPEMVTLTRRAAECYGCPPAEVETIELAAMLHDLGKIGVPDEILSKPGKLTDAEWQLMQRHSDVGAEIVQSLTRLNDVTEIIRSHHEQYDGSGYPRGLVGSWIPLGARILSVVDSYDAIITGRIYRAARTHAEALAEIRRCAGTQFDPVAVAVFVSVFDQETLK